MPPTGERITPAELEQRRLLKDKNAQRLRAFAGTASGLKGESTKFQKDPTYDREKLVMQAQAAQRDITAISLLLETDKLDPEWLAQ